MSGSALAAPADLVVHADGHVDYGARLIDGKLESQVKDGSGSAVVWREPADVAFHVRPRAERAVPDDPRFAFLGDPGDPVWVIPQIQVPGVLWGGLDTQEISPTDVAGHIRLSLIDVDGPGDVALFSTDLSGPSIHVDSRDGLPDAHELPLDTHSHPNWAFTRQGVYRLTFEMTATLASGANTSDVETLTVVVGPMVLSDGHVDYAARLIDGGLQSQIKANLAGGLTWYEPSDAIFHLRPGARIDVPADPSFGFLGNPGDPMWVIPQVKVPGVLWAGWNTEEIEPSALFGDVAWTLSHVQGPGNVALYLSDEFGQPIVVFNAADGLPDTLAVPANTHAHGNWAFTREGVYRLTFEASAVVPAGGITSDTETLIVLVGGDGTWPPSYADPEPDPSPMPSPAPTPTPQPNPQRPAEPSTTPPAGPRPGPDRLTLTLAAARLRGRTLTVRLRLSQRSRVSVAVRQGRRTAARARSRDVPAGVRTLRVRLSRRPRPGRYAVRIEARAGTGQIVRTLALRVRSTDRDRASRRARPRVSAAMEEPNARDG